MKEPDLQFLPDGSILSWVAQDGQIFVEVSDSGESHSHRWVWSPPDIAAMLFSALTSGTESSHLVSNIICYLKWYLDAQFADSAREGSG